MAKSHIVREIIESVRRASPKGGFVKKVSGKWFDVGERARREKTGQQIRDLLHTQYRSSTKSKAMTRKRLRKSHSENSATRVNTEAAVASVMASRTGTLPARIVTLDSETSPDSAAAAARSAMARQAHFRRNSESDLSAVANRDRSTQMASFDLTREASEATYDGLHRLREAEVSFSNPMNRMTMHMGSNMNSMNMNQSSMNMNQSSMGMSMGMSTQGWGSMAGVNSDTFPSVQQPGAGLMQPTTQPHFSSMLQQSQPASIMSQHNAYGGISQASFVPPLGPIPGSHFDGQPHFGMDNSFRPQNNFAYSSAAFNSPAVMMQGQANPMQAYISSNTRPHDNTNYNQEMMFQRTGRMVRPIPPEEGDPLLLPVDSFQADSNMFKEGSGLRGCHMQQPQHDDHQDEESEKSFEEAIDNIYTVETPSKRL